MALRAESPAQPGISLRSEVAWHGRGRGRRHVFLAESHGRGAARTETLMTASRETTASIPITEVPFDCGGVTEAPRVSQPADFQYYVVVP